MVALADLGPGDLSLDHALGTEVKGPLVALLALVGGIGTATLLTRQSSHAEPSGGEATAGDPAASETSEPVTA
jgi:putative oxidoreductase